MIKNSQESKDKGVNIQRLQKVEDDIRITKSLFEIDEIPCVRKVSDQVNQPEQRLRLQAERRKKELEEQKQEQAQRHEDEQEEQYVQQEVERIADRERIGKSKAPSAIPAPSPPKGGVVYSSESEEEVVEEKGWRQFKWKDAHEIVLEELLIEFYFDFELAANEFQRRMGKDFDITADTLRVKWTDVEIKKYRMEEMSKQESESEPEVMTDEEANMMMSEEEQSEKNDIYVSNDLEELD